MQQTPSFQPLPPITSAPPSPGKVHLYHWLWCTAVFNKYLLKTILKAHSANAAAVPELCLSAEFVSAHFKLHLGMGDLMFIFKKITI